MAKRFSIHQCPKCGKYFEPMPGAKWCAECTASHEASVALVDEAIQRGNESVVDIVAATGLPEKVVRKVLHNTRSLGWLVDDETPCTRCRRQPAQPGSDFCLDCRLVLNTLLGKTVARMAREAVQQEVEPEAARPVDNVNANVERKRGRLPLVGLFPSRQRLK